MLSNGNPQRAAHELQIASKLKPGTAKILLPLGISLSELNQQDAAIDAFRAILRQEPRSVPALDGLAKALIAQGRYAAAISELKNAPANEVLRLNLALGDFYRHALDAQAVHGCDRVTPAFVLEGIADGGNLLQP